MNALNIPTIPGLIYVEEFLTSDEEQALITRVDRHNGAWLTDLSRRVQHYGYRYNYKNRTVTADDYLGPLPDWLEALASALTVVGSMDWRPDQAIVNEYMPGQGISAHVDCVPCFGPTIATISLGSVCIMRVRKLGQQEERQDVTLHARSALIFSGDARYKWTHEIPARKTDTINGVVIARKRRLSITFRTVQSQRLGKT